MKKSLLKTTVVALAFASVLFITGCKPKEENAAVENQNKKEVVKDPVALSDIPASGAKTYITTQVGASNFVKNISQNVDSEKLVEEAESVIDIDEIKDQIEEIYENSEYAETLETTVSKIADTIREAVEKAGETGAVDINIDEKPGQASDFPEGYALDIPQVLIKAKGSVDNIQDPKSGSGEAEISLSAKAAADKISVEIPVLNVKANANVNTDVVKQAIKADGTVGEQLSVACAMDGLSLKINTFNNDVKIRGDFDGSKGSGTVNLNDDISTEIIFDAAKLGIPSSPVKYLKSVGSIKGNLDGTPAMNSDQSFRGNVNYDYALVSKTGISFAGTDGTGGKVIADTQFKFKGTFNLAEIMQFESIMADLGSDLFAGTKLTEEEFADKHIPFESVISVKFYDDNNKETLDFLNIKSTYELYSFIYDYISGLDEDELYDLADKLEDFTDDFGDIFSELKYLF